MPLPGVTITPPPGSAMAEFLEDRLIVRSVCLRKLTEQGIKNIKDAPKRIEKGIKAYEAMGGKVLAFYSVMGEYNYVVYRSSQ